MGVTDELKWAAAEKADFIKNRWHETAKELEKLRARQSKLEAQLDEVKFAMERAKNFQPEVSGEFQCPFAGLRVKSSWC